jgi:hypothetical protein
MKSAAVAKKIAHKSPGTHKKVKETLDGRNTSVRIIGPKAKGR